MGFNAIHGVQSRNFSLYVVIRRCFIVLLRFLNFLKVLGEKNFEFACMKEKGYLPKEYNMLSPLPRPSLQFAPLVPLFVFNVNC